MGELATVVGPQVASLRQAPSGVFEPHACEPGALLLESTLLAYGRGKMSVLATDPVDKFELSAHQRLPENWAERLDRFIGDGSRFCSLFFSYDFGAELVRGPNCYTISSNGIPRVLAYKYDRAQIIESDPQVKSRLDAVTLGQPPAGLELRRPDRGDYMRDVRRIKEHIREGDIYQANLTGQWEVESTASPWDVYLRLRDLNPAQYGGFAKLDDATILSSSPERLVSVCGDSIIANPIKGTIERGPTDREALHNQSLLLASAKDRAELLMIVDLLRNDLGKICRYGTVKTHSIWKPEVYSSLIHLVGDIRGQLRPHTTVSEIIRATLPGGSITGAPKRRAVEILSEIEGRPRGIYTGSFGYAYRDRLDLNIAIRTITHTLTESGPTFVVQAGGGIVADSDSAAEFDEARLKARNLLKAIDPALEP